MKEKETLLRIVQTWFEETDPKNWFSGGETFDRFLKKNWSEYYQASLNGAYHPWKKTPEGRLALCLLWDQFPRNVFRGTPRAFLSDGLALQNVYEALALKQDIELDTRKRVFLYMPLMHSERLEDQARSVALFHDLNENSARFALLHARVIQKFGRFPGRNKALGRATTPSETAFLNSDEGKAF